MKTCNLALFNLSHVFDWTKYYPRFNIISACKHKLDLLHMKQDDRQHKKMPVQTILGKPYIANALVSFLQNLTSSYNFVLFNKLVYKQ